uniref:Uncharacterized protein n=1 Tax=Ditylenchus dipsaci TaxID=166011 RepID=A0A915CZ86_9BILA
MNRETKKLDLERTVLLLEHHIQPADFFELCACYGLDEPTERVYASLSREQCERLLQHNAACRCRILELSQRSSMLYYDEIALECASSGHLQPLERSLMRINVLDDTLLPKCVLRAIDSNHYHIANHIVCDNFEKAFYSLFPDGHVPAEFFVKLIEPQDALVQGEQIATALLRYLPTLDVQRLRRLIQNEPQIRKSVLIRFDAMYSEIIDTRNYPCDYD